MVVDGAWELGVDVAAVFSERWFGSFAKCAASASSQYYDRCELGRGSVLTKRYLGRLHRDLRVCLYEKLKKGVQDIKLWSCPSIAMTTGRKETLYNRFWEKRWNEWRSWRERERTRRKREKKWMMRDWSMTGRPTVCHGRAHFGKARKATFPNLDFV